MRNALAPVARLIPTRVCSRLNFVPLAIAAVAVIGSVMSPAVRAAGPADVDANRIIEADKTPGDWLTYGRT